MENPNATPVQPTALDRSGGSLPFSPVDDAMAYSDAGDRTPHDPLAILTEEVRRQRRVIEKQTAALKLTRIVLKGGSSDMWHDVIAKADGKQISLGQQIDAALREANAAVSQSAASADPRKSSRQSGG